MRRLLMIIPAMLLNILIAAEPQRVLFVVTSHELLGDTGRPTGFWLPELTHPAAVFDANDIHYDIASPKGGAAPIDASSDPRHTPSMAKDLVSTAFVHNPEKLLLVEKTLRLADCDSARYHAVLVVGGNGAVFDLPTDADLQRILKQTWEADRIVAALCHGTAALLDVRLSNGTFLVAKHKLTGFSNAEEERLQGNKGPGYLPFLLEDHAKIRGAEFLCKNPFEPFAVEDGRLITGQQHLSGQLTGEAIVRALR